MRDERHQVAGSPAGEIEGGNAPVTVEAFDQPPAVPQGPQVHCEMQDPEMQEHRGDQPPPFSVLGRRAESCAPGELYVVWRMPESGPLNEHRREYEQVGGKQRSGHGRARRPARHQLGYVQQFSSGRFDVRAIRGYVTLGRRESIPDLRRVSIADLALDACYSPTNAAINLSRLNFGFSARRAGTNCLAIASRSALLVMLVRIAWAMAMTCLRVKCTLQAEHALVAHRRVRLSPHVDQRASPPLHGLLI